MCALVCNRDVRDHPHIVNFDNYSNIIASYIATSDKGAYANCAWTGHTLRKLDVKYDMSHAFKHHELVPAMPKTLFSDSLWATLVADLSAIDGHGSRYLASSHVNIHKVRSFPPKPKVCQELRDEDADLADLLESGSRDGLQDVYPSDISVENCGSNAGLAMIMRNIYRDYGALDGNCDDYIPIMTDVNIYHRIMKVTTHAR
jgi:hypothetical protein